MNDFQWLWMIINGSSVIVINDGLNSYGLTILDQHIALWPRATPDMVTQSTTQWEFQGMVGCTKYLWTNQPLSSCLTIINHYQLLLHRHRGLWLHVSNHIRGLTRDCWVSTLGSLHFEDWYLAPETSSPWDLKPRSTRSPVHHCIRFFP